MQNSQLKKFLEKQGTLILVVIILIFHPMKELQRKYLIVSNKLMKKIAIIGGGISGLYFANLLNNKKSQICLIDVMGDSQTSITLLKLSITICGVTVVISILKPKSAEIFFAFSYSP